MTTIWKAGTILLAITAVLFMAESVSTVFAQEPKPGNFRDEINKLVESTREQAKALTDRHAAILDALSKAKSPDEANKALQEMIDFDTTAIKLFGNDNEIWK